VRTNLHLCICGCLCACVCVRESERVCVCVCACMCHKVPTPWTHMQRPGGLFEKSPIKIGGGALIETHRLAVREWLVVLSGIS